jgi:hypothetical protein
MMRAPDRKAGIDINAPLGTYAVDAFLERFTKPGLKPEKAEPIVKDAAIIATYRRDVTRIAQLALIRTRHDKVDLPAWAGDAGELLDAIAELQPNLEHLIALSEERGLATFAAETSRVLRDVDGGRTAAASVVHTIEAAKGLRDWIEHVGKAFKIERAPPHSSPLPNHVAALAVEMHRRRLREFPAVNRDGWFADFLVALWRDCGWPCPAGKEEDDDFRLYLGRKVEDVVGRLKDAAPVSPD